MCLQQGTFSEKEEQLRQILAKLDTIENDSGASSLSHDDIVALRRQLSDGQSLLRDTIDRLRQSQEENEILGRRREELESRISGLETEYEDLLGAYLNFFLHRLNADRCFYPANREDNQR